jgi:hypothetical protein
MEFARLSKYVVVEGNRRITALKWLQSNLDNALITEEIEEGIDETYLDNLANSISTVEVLVYKGGDKDIAWLLQGIRHISGIKEWEPAQQARLVAEKVDEGHKFKQVGQMFGLSAKQVGRLYRTYKALQQMKYDQDYGTKAENKHFSLLEEAYKSPGVRKWLGWDDKLYSFENAENLKTFYSWILPDDDNENKQRISNTSHVRALSRILEREHDELIGDIDRYEVTVEQADLIVRDEPINHEWHRDLEKAKSLINRLPFEAFSQESEALKQGLSELKNLIDSALNKL